jgi:hypothetical protein
MPGCHVRSDWSTAVTAVGWRVWPLQDEMADGGKKGRLSGISGRDVHMKRRTKTENVRNRSWQNTAAQLSRYFMQLAGRVPSPLQKNV